MSWACCAPARLTSAGNVTRIAIVELSTDLGEGNPMNQPSPQQEPEPISPELLEGLRHELNRPKSTPAFGDFVTVATILYLTWGVWHEMSGH